MNSTISSSRSFLTRTIIFVVLVLTGLYFQSCAPPVQFSEPQPAGEKNLESFPEKIRGNYLNQADSSVLSVMEKIIVRHYVSHLQEPRQDLDTLFRLVDDSILLNRETNEQTKVRVINDTIIGVLLIDDTIFNISEDNVLRKFKGSYFLNTAYSNSWEVQMLDLHKGKLTIGQIPSKEGMEKLKAITPSAVDSASGNVQITSDQFKEFVKGGGFYNREEYERINDSSNHNPTDAESGK